jgi:hypothetical protein
LFAAEITKGINTIELKLESQCTGFRRMDALFGGRQNVTPHSVYEPGGPAVSGFSDNQEEYEEVDEDYVDEEQFLMDIMLEKITKKLKIVFI